MFFAHTAKTAPSERNCSETIHPYVVNVDGSGVRRLMDSCRGFFNGWSSTGDKVAFTIFPGTGPFPVTNTPFWESDPVWLTQG